MSSETRALDGRFVWFDVFSSDPAGSAAFLTDLLGWSLDPQHAGEARPYRMFLHGGRAIGGVLPLFGPPGATSRFVPYVHVDDVAGACARAGAAGGAVHGPPRTIAGVGTFATIADPDGGALAVISLERQGDDAAPPHPAPEGAPAWFELPARSPARAQAFYSAVLDWTWRDEDLGPLGTYHVARAGELDVGGCMQLPEDAAGSPAWMQYVHVGDVDATHARALELGGAAHAAPADAPGVGRFAVLADPAGAVFAVVRPAAPWRPC